jgi:hypothetical protein
MELNKTVLEDVIAWGRDLRGFTEKHAIDGLTLVQGFAEGVLDERGCRVEGVGARGDRSLFLLAVDMACLIWLDDCFDARPSGADKLVDWEALARSADARPTTPEAYGFFKLRSCFAEEARDPAAYELWLRTAVDVFLASHEDELLSRGERSWSYTEFLHNGENSIAVSHVVATISLVYGFDMPERMKDARFLRVLRDLSLAMRLQNDLASVEKERVEGNRSNAVLFIEKFMPREQAWSFVAEQREGYERLLFQELAAFGEGDPFHRVAEIMLASTERFYVVPRDRYLGRSNPTTRAGRRSGAATEASAS